MREFKLYIQPQGNEDKSDRHYPVNMNDVGEYTEILPYHYQILRECLCTSDKNHIVYGDDRQVYISSIPKGSCYLDISHTGILLSYHDTIHTDLLHILDEYNTGVTGIYDGLRYIPSFSVYRYHDEIVNIWKITYTNRISVYRLFDVDPHDANTGIKYDRVRSIPLRITTLWIPYIYAYEDDLLADIHCHITPLHIERDRQEYTDVIIFTTI